MAISPMRCSGSAPAASAWFCRDTGKVHRSDFDDDGEDLPDDIDDTARYPALPGKRDFDLGNAPVLQFVREQLPDQYDHIRDVFHHGHAYARYKALLEKCDKLTAWYAYEARATESALRQWCADNDLPLAD